jgi:hypothetical protein
MIEYELYSTYIRWYGLLKAWAMLLVGEAVAARCARRTMAEMFVEACNAVETMDGPYMRSVDVLYRHICMQPGMNEKIFVGSAFQQMSYPDGELVAYIAKLYAAVYHMSYTAAWTIRDRQEVQIYLRLFDPYPMSQDKIIESLERCGPVTHPFRCGVEAMTNHTHDEELICAASCALWEQEETRGLEWLANSMITNGAG